MLPELWRSYAAVCTLNPKDRRFGGIADFFVLRV
jgi:hypothetical protein